MDFVNEKADMEVAEGPEGHGIPLDIPEQVLEVVEQMMPGADLVITMPEEKETDWENDGDHSKFIPHLHNKVKKIPRHSGETTVGCERAISYLKKCNRDLSSAVQSDENNLIDEHKAEELRDLIMDMTAQLEEAHSNLMEKKHKKHKKAASLKVGKTVVARMNDGVDIQYFMSVDTGAGEELFQVAINEPTDTQVQTFAAGETFGITKEAGSAKIVLFEDPFLHSITRILINSHVSAGKNIEDVYNKLKKKYAFTSREELSIQELLLQKGLQFNKDLGRLGEEDYNSFDGMGVEHNTTYYA